MGSGMPGMGSGMMGMGSGMMNQMMSSMNFGSMMPSMMMGGMTNDPMMSLVMSSIELGAADYMILNTLVRTIVGPQASANAAMMVLYNTDGGLPLSAVRMIPYVTLMQGIAKDLKIKVPGVKGEATNEQIDQYIFQRALSWMQQRNMAGAFLELPGVGMMFMNNAMRSGMQSITPSPPTQKQTTVPQSTSQAAAAARAALAKFVAASKAAAAKKKAADAAKTTTAPKAPTPVVTTKPAAKPTTAASPPPKFDAALFAKFMADAAAASASTENTNTQPAGMMGIAFPSGMNSMGGMGEMGGMGGMNGMSGMNGNMNPAMMAMGGMELMGF